VKNIVAYASFFIKVTIIAAAKQVEMSQGSNTSIFKAVGLTSKLLTIHINEQLFANSIELTRHQFVLLKVLGEKEGSCQNDLAFLTERDKTSLGRLVNSLETKGYVKKLSDVIDKRKRMIYLTNAGRNVLSKAWPIMVEIEKEITNDLDPMGVESTIRILNQIQTKVLRQESVLV